MLFQFPKILSMLIIGYKASFLKDEKLKENFFLLSYNKQIFGERAEQENTFTQVLY